MTLGSSYPITIYQSFYVTSERYIDPYQHGSGLFDYSWMSYMISSTIEDGKSCHRSDPAESLIADLSVSEVECADIGTESWGFSITDETSIATFDDTLSLTTQELNLQEQIVMDKCSSYPTITATAAGTNSLPTQCFNYLSAVYLPFDPPTVTSPTTCTDAVWQY